MPASLAKDDWATWLGEIDAPPGEAAQRFVLIPYYVLECPAALLLSSSALLSTFEPGAARYNLGAEATWVRPSCREARKALRKSGRIPKLQLQVSWPGFARSNRS